MILPVVAMLSVLISGQDQAAPRYGAFNLDVVALLRDGKESGGSQELAVDRGGYRYLFAHPVNRDAFMKSPERYEVQLGGACARTGELSERGIPERFWVHRRRLYIFSSDACREAFKLNPEAFIERDQPAPKALKPNLDRGAQLIGQARQWTGLDKLTTKSTITLAGPAPGGSYVRVGPGWDYLERSETTFQITNGQAVEINPQGVTEALAPTWRRALERRRGRSLAYMLTAKPDRRTMFAYRSSTGGTALVDVFLDRELSSLRIQEGTGKVVGMTVRGRDANGALGMIDRTFTQYRTADGITWPISWTATFNGADAPGLARQGDKITIGG